MLSSWIRTSDFYSDRIKDALLLVASNGKVLYANPAAHAILPLTIGDPVLGDWLGGQINAVQRGYPSRLVVL